MWLTRQGKSFRVWFQAVRGTGKLRTGLPGSSFTVTVIDASDTTSMTLPVTESSQRLGNYYCDVPSSFLVSNGPGDYSISIEIDSQSGSAGAPHVVSSHASILQVTREDVDTLSGSIWNTNSSQFNASGTMGYLQNQIAAIAFSSSLDVQQVVSGVWNASTSTFDTPGTMGHLENMLPSISSSVTFIQGIENGSWIITGSQMVFYASGTGAELARFELQDLSGSPIDPATQNPFKRIRL